VADYQDDLWKAMKLILNKGGEFKVNVSKRGQERIVVIQTFPENYIRCNTVTMVTDD
jgi:hypothetical protein